MSDIKCVIIIPTYEEALGIERTLHEVFKTCSSLLHNIHVLIFDSASQDDTQNIVKRLQKQYANLHLKTESKKTGLGSAYLQAMRYALNHLNADVVMEFDADLSHQPHYIIPILEQLRSCDVVIGSRYVKGGSIPKNWGYHRKFLSRMGNYISRILLTPKYKDFTSGFRATNHVALHNALPQQFISNHYAYKLELLWNLHKSNAKIIEYPIAFVDRDTGVSKLPANSIVDSLYVLGVLRFNELKSYLNMCAIGGLGLFVQCLVYNVLRFNLSPFISAQIAVTAAIMNNFLLNNKYTFQKRNVDKSLKRFGYFLGFSILMVVAQSHWIDYGVRNLGGGLIKENFIVACGVITGSVLNYLFYSRLLWAKKKRVNNILN